MKGGHIPEHYMVMLQPREAAALALLAKAMREPEAAHYFGINEFEDELLEKLGETLDGGGSRTRLS